MSKNVKVCRYCGYPYYSVDVDEVYCSEVCEVYSEVKKYMRRRGINE